MYRYTSQTRASFDQYLDLLPILFHQREVTARAFTPQGEKVCRLQFVGCRTSAPMMLESDGRVHPVTPDECRLRCLTYSSPMYVNVHVHSSDRPSSVIPDVYIGRIPVMRGCKIDPAPPKENDCMGYFIVNGSEKSIVSQKAHAHNSMLTYHKKVGDVDHWAIACKSEKDQVVLVTTIKKKEQLVVTFPRLKREIGFASLLSILGITPPMLLSVLSEGERALVQSSIDRLDPHMQLKETYNLGDDLQSRYRDVLRTSLLPHVKEGEKGLYLILMLKKLHQDIEAYTWSDKDSLFNQRIEMPYDLMVSITRHLLVKMTNDFQNQIQRVLRKNKNPITDATISRIIGRSTSLSDGLQYCLGTGIWNTQYTDKRVRVGVAQVLQRGSVLSAVSQMRRISSSIAPDQKLTKPRALHGTHWARLDVVETPEGSPCGLENQLALKAIVSIASPTAPILDVVSQYLEPPCLARINETRVFLNGEFIGTTETDDILDVLREGRRNGQFSRDMSVAKERDIHIRTTAGRILRPLYICPVDIGDFDTQLSRGKIEYLDPHEEDTMYVAFKPEDVNDHTHCEIDCCHILGVCSATIPLLNHNPGPRNTYEAAMLKQAQCLQPADRMDTTTNVLCYGQSALVQTDAAPPLPTGQNCIVAVMCYEGYNQEDSVILNRRSLDFGLFRSIQYKTFKETSNGCQFEKPRTVGRSSDYSKLRDDGLPRLHEKIEVGDCLVGKTRTFSTGTKKRKIETQDVSLHAKRSGIVDKVLLYKERDGSDGVKVRLRDVRIPQRGDKFASRSAQKGTCGAVVAPEDLPFTASGIIPDLILNPHSMPSRMTCAHMLESLMSKIGALTGKIQDGTPFRGTSVEDLCKELERLGFRGDGTEWMYDGKTGKRIKSRIFITPIYYQRLKHMVKDKCHARGRGRVNALTKQPCSGGRGNGGGLRIGEMEKDSLLSHGVPFVIDERMKVSSDAHDMSVCSVCGSTTVLHGKCRQCGGAEKVLSVPYASTLLYQELQAMCVDVRLRT